MLPATKLALQRIIQARDIHAECGEYPAYPNGPREEDQCFDDWAADVCEEALKGET